MASLSPPPEHAPFRHRRHSCNRPIPTVAIAAATEAAIFAAIADAAERGGVWEAQLGSL